MQQITQQIARQMGGKLDLPGTLGHLYVILTQPDIRTN